MTRFHAVFRCVYCDSELPVEETDPGWFESEEVHGCFGERVGNVAYQEPDLGFHVTHDSVRVELEEVESQ